MPHFFASNLHAVALPARTKNFEFIFEAKSVRDESAIIFVKSLAKSLHGGQKILLSKQKKGARFLVKFNKHFSTHSKEIIKSALKEYADLAGAEIVSHNLNENKIKVDSAYLLDWHGICALLAGNSSLGLHSADFANLGRFADFGPVSHPKFAKNHESQTENPSVVDSAISQNLGKNSPIHCHSERSEESQNNQNRDSSVASLPQNDNMKKAQNDKVKKSQNNKVGTRIAESRLDSADSAPSTQEANSSIFDEKSGLCSCERENRTNGSLTKRATNLPDLSQKDEEFAMLEIGFGSGRHILHLAQKHPTAQIIGLEIYRPAISQVLRQIEILGLKNLYLASLDARVLCEVLPAKCLDRIYLHFPVPWDKNPQRRVLSVQFLSNAMRALKDDGFFELLTDSAEYFAFAKSLAGDYKFVAEEGAEGEVVSKYEARWRRQEKVIYKLCIYPACGNSPLYLGNSVLGMQFRTCENFQSNSSLRADSQNLRGNLLCERIAESTESRLDSAIPLLFLFSRKRAAPPAPLPLRAKSCRFSLLGGEPRLSASSKKSAGGTTAPFDSDFLHHEAGEFSGASHNSFLDSAFSVPFSPTKICKKEYFLHIKNKYIFEGGVVLFASFGAYYAPSSAYFVICGNEVSTISEIIPTRANIDALGLFMELCFDN